MSARQGNIRRSGTWISVCWPSNGSNGLGRRARVQAPFTEHEIRRSGRGVVPVYSKTHGAASGRSVDFVAEIGVNGTACYIGASNSILGLFPPLPDRRSYENGQDVGGLCGRYESQSRCCDAGSKHSLPVIALLRHLGRSPGPGRWPPRLGVGDDVSRNAQTTPDPSPVARRSTSARCRYRASRKSGGSTHPSTPVPERTSK